MEHRASNKTSSKNFKRFIMPAVIIIVAVFVTMVVTSLLIKDKPNADRYQVVVLSSGQTYFGKLKNISGDYLTLENVYYNTAAEVPEDATPEQIAATSGNSTLVKMGSEVYGPESTLKIRSEQVLFWQNLAEDSKVGKAIESAQ